MSGYAHIGNCGGSHEGIACWEAELLRSRIPPAIRGDGPCMDCGTVDNIMWSTDSMVWNYVLGGPGQRDDPGGILCIPCYVVRVHRAGLRPRGGWTLVPK